AHTGPPPLPRPRHRVPPRWTPAAMGLNTPALPRSPALTTRVDGDHDALAPEALGRLADERGALERGGVQRDLVGPRPQEPSHVVDRADAAADGQRHVDALGGAARDVEHDLARLVRGGDIEEDELVGALRVVCER